MGDIPAGPPAQPQHVADGQYGNTGLHWWLEKLPGLATPQLTVTGFAGGSYVSWSGPIEAPSPASVRRQVAELEADALTRADAKAARKAARAAG